jgi:glycine betaine/proline transport system substrate-binding protein
MHWKTMNWKLIILTAIVAVSLIGLASPGLAKKFEVGFVNQFKEFPGQGVMVKPARATWTTGFILEALYSRGLEHLGYTVHKHKDLSNPIFYKSLVQGDIDYWANGWFPLHNEQLPEMFEEKASKVGYVVKQGAIQGYLASKFAVDKYDITSLEDFKRPEVKKAFDSDGDGKAELVSCPPGWGCHVVTAHHMDYYDLHDHVDAITASYSASMADAVTKHNNGQPVVYHTWTPNWTVNELVPGKDVMWINVPFTKPTPGQKGLEEAMVASGLEGAVSDPCKMGFPANDIRVVANNDFLKANPAAKKLFEVMSIPMEDISNQNDKMFKGEDDQEDIERHATEWIKENKELWMKWQKAARDAAK